MYGFKGALQANSTGSYNTAIGDQALEANLAGNNTADHRSFNKSIHCALQIFKNRNKK